MSETVSTVSLPDHAPVPRSALGPALNEPGYYVGRVEGNLCWVTHGTYQSALLTTSDGVVLLDAPPTIGHNIHRAVDEIASANGVSSKVNYLTFWAPPGAHMLAYVASKGALIGITRTLAVALGGDGIAVTAVAPGLTHTPATVDIPAAEFADVEARQALARSLTPDDAAAVVAMLASDDAAALTGQTLTVDGGLVLR